MSQPPLSYWPPPGPPADRGGDTPLVLAIISAGLGVLGLPAFCTVFIPLAAVALSAIALVMLARSNRPLSSNKSVAAAIVAAVGLVLGLVGCVLAALFLVNV